MEEARNDPVWKRSRTTKSVFGTLQVPMAIVPPLGGSSVPPPPPTARPVLVTSDEDEALPKLLDDEPAAPLPSCTVSMGAADECATSPVMLAMSNELLRITTWPDSADVMCCDGDGSVGILTKEKSFEKCTGASSGISDADIEEACADACAMLVGDLMNDNDDESLGDDHDSSCVWEI